MRARKDPRVRQVSVSASARPGRWSRSCAPTARPIATSARWCASTSRSSPAKATGRKPAATAMAGARAMQRFIETGAWKRRGRRRGAPGAGQSRSGAGAGRRDGRRARPRLARRDAARGGRPRARRRLQSQEDLGLRRPDGPAGRRQGRHRGRRRHASPTRRGSLTIDDEGTPTNRTVLIEDGILVGYMQDRQNARLMGMKPTGNGRRESYGHVPMPRMTNTYMLAGNRDPAGDHRVGEERHLRGVVRRRPGRHHLGQIRVPVHRGLQARERQGRRADQGRDADRQRPDRPASHHA